MSDSDPTRRLASFVWAEGCGVTDVVVGATAVALDDGRTYAVSGTRGRVAVTDEELERAQLEFSDNTPAALEDYLTGVWRQTLVAPRDR